MKQITIQNKNTSRHFCLICDSAYIETSQTNVEYVCTMCRDNIRIENDKRCLPNENNVIQELIMDCGNL